MFRQVLVPIDGSPGVDRLVQAAAATAGRLDAGLLLWGVVPPGGDRRAMEIHLYELLSRFAQGHGAFMAVAAADPVEGLVERAESAPGTLLCVVSHGLGRIGEESMGCLTAELLLRARTPVLVIGPRVDVHGVADPRSWQHIVACVDASDRGERALSHAADFARATGLDLTVMQAVTAADELFDGERTRQYVDALARSVRPTASGVVLDATDRPAQALCCAANRMGGAILAVASRGRGGPGPGALSFEPVGSVTNELIRASRTPILVVPEVPSLAGAVGGGW